MDMRFLTATARIAVRASLTRYQQQEHVRQLGYKIQKGFYGEVSLDGLTGGMTAKWLDPINEGNGERQIIIDKKASSEQLKAIATILSGEDTEETSTIQWAINVMTSTHHKTLYKSVKVEGDIPARNGQVVVDRVFEVVAEPTKNQVTGEVHRVRIDNPNGFEFTIADMATETTKTVGGNISLPNNEQTHSHICEIHWNNSGVIKNSSLC